MRFIKDLKEGCAVQDIYLCKQKNSATTKNGKEYYNMVLQDKTGTMDAKVWETGSAGIGDFESHDYIFVNGEVTSFNGSLQVNIRQVRVASENEYNEEDYFPVSKKNNDAMYQELLTMIDKVTNQYFNSLLKAFFVDDKEFVQQFRKASAAKTVHHAFIGGLLEHTLSVTKLCQCYCMLYPDLKQDLLLTAAMCHDIGKIREFSSFPDNDYTDDGNLLGHIVMGSEMVSEKIKEIKGFPKGLESELKHCILAHHGKMEFGSPKTPSLMEAVALNFADDTDAKMQIFAEFRDKTSDYNWVRSYFLDGNIRLTHGE